ncbi:hypothetical protein [Paenibacillus daejeonensis]|nr:hypothetical protein [Paenibacillus daejeonensis]
MRSLLISVLMVVVVIVIYDSLGGGQGAEGEIRQFGGRHGQAIREVDP